MSYPEYVKINDKKYKINTDFRVAIECNKIAEDETIGNFERALAIIYKLYGEEGLNDTKNYAKLLELGQKFLFCGKKIEHSEEEPDMDFAEDMVYIEASFMSDYHIDLANTKMHWWKFNNLINGLSNSEMGNCCVLNRIRNLRNYDIKDIKDAKEREKIIKAKKSVELKRNQPKLTKEQEQSVEFIYNTLLKKGV
jgi:hypothetical protein